MVNLDPEEEEEAAMGDDSDRSSEAEHDNSTPPISPAASTSASSKGSSITALDTLGGRKAYHLRLRLLSLLSLASYTYPSIITALNDLLYDNIRPLPPSQYTLYLHTSTTTHLPTPMLISLLPTPTDPPPPHLRHPQLPRRRFPVSDRTRKVLPAFCGGKEGYG